MWNEHLSAALITLVLAAIGLCVLVFIIMK